MNQNMYNNKIDNPIAYIDKDGAFVQENHRAKELGTYAIIEKHSPKYFRINDQDNIYDYLNGDLSTNSTKGGKDIPFKIAAYQIDNASKHLYKNQHSYKDILNLDRTYNLDKRIVDYTSDKLMKEWKSIDSQMENIYQQYSLGNVTPKKMQRAAKKYEKAADKYNGYFKNLSKNATHFNIANLINDGRSVVTGKGPLYDSMTKGIWSLISGGIGAGFAPVVLSKVISATPWIMKNIAVPWLGGEIVNEGTRLLSDEKYQTVGEYVYDSSGLKHLLDGTIAEDPARYVAEMVNPGYYLPYKKISNVTGLLIDDAGRALQNKGFFTPSVGIIPANSLGMNLPKFTIKEPLTLEKINTAANNKNINISGEPPTTEELSKLNKYVKRQNNRKGEPIRQIYKENGQYKYNYGYGTETHNLDLNNIPNSNTGLWNWIKEHKWPFIGVGIGLTTGLGPYILGKGIRSIIDAPDYFMEGLNPEPQKTSEPNKQPELPKVRIGYIRNNTIPQDSTFTW